MPIWSARPLSPGGEFALIALGLLAPCMIAFSVARPGWRRLVLVLGATALGCLATTLSTALNFGPQHLLAWSTPQALAALAFGACWHLMSVAPGRAAAGLGLMALTALVTVVAQAPADPYFAQSLQLWEQGRFIRFHGAARWVGWLWPYAAIAYLLARLGAKEEQANGVARLKCRHELLRAPHLLLPEPARERRERLLLARRKAGFDHCKSRVKGEGSPARAACASTRPAAWTAAPAGRSRWSTPRRSGTPSWTSTTSTRSSIRT